MIIRWRSAKAWIQSTDLIFHSVNLSLQHYAYYTNTAGIPCWQWPESLSSLNELLYTKYKRFTEKHWQRSICWLACTSLRKPQVSVPKRKGNGEMRACLEALGLKMSFFSFFFFFFFPFFFVCFFVLFLLWGLIDICFGRKHLRLAEVEAIAVPLLT